MLNDRDKPSTLDAIEPSGLFAAYVVSYLPPDPKHALKRRLNLHKSLSTWRQMTSFPVHVIASNWSQLALDNDPELALLSLNGGSVIVQPAQPVAENRNAAFAALYASTHAFGIIMDDDACLSHGPAYNSGFDLFHEMAANGMAAYSDIDIFFPINPQKKPGQNTIWKADPILFRDHHVFTAAYDLKGTMFVVRNFPLFGRPAVLAPTPFPHVGEDTLLAVEAVKKGCTVYRCDNVVLQEYSGPSHFVHSKPVMKIGNTAIASIYAADGLKMSIVKKREHLLDRTAFVAKHIGSRPARVVIPKP
jgi:hypothetical protein